MRKELLKKLKAAVKKTSILAESKASGIPYATMYRILHGGMGNMRTWEAIQKHYK